MRPEAVGHAFEERGLAGLANRPDGLARGDLDGDDIQSRRRGRTRCRRSRPSRGYRRWPRCGRWPNPWRSRLFFADKRAPGRFQSAARFEGFRGTRPRRPPPLPEETGGDVRLPPHPVGKGETARQRQAAADDGVAAVEVRLGVGRCASTPPRSRSEQPSALPYISAMTRVIGHPARQRVSVARGRSRTSRSILSKHRDECPRAMASSPS